MSRLIAQHLADFATDVCPRCDQHDGSCIENPKIKNCLMSDALIGRFGAEMYTVRPQLPRTDFRRWNFDDDLTHEQLCEILRRNA